VSPSPPPTGSFLRRGTRLLAGAAGIIGTVSASSVRETGQGAAAAARGEATRGRILKAASSLFLEKGFDGTSVSAIAQASKVSVPALYWHFESKTEICFAYLEMAMAEFSQRMLGQPDEGTPLERLRRFVRSYIHAQLDDREKSSAYERLFTFGQLSTTLDDEHRLRLATMQREVVARLRMILQDGADQGVFTSDVRLASFAITSACEFSYQWFNPEGPLTIEQIADRYVQMMQALAIGDTTAPLPA
jgi:AcrR family transcriptional regulator